MDNFTGFDSVESVHEQLRTLSTDNVIIENLRRCLLTWDYKSSDSIDYLKEDIQQVVKELTDLFFPNNIGNNNTFELLKAFVHGEIYDGLLFRLKETFTGDDLKVYRISKEFCKSNGTPKQLGATFYNFVPSAAVVELSMLNNKRTPIAKLKCLQSSYDYIFAEVKGALISVISKYSEKEIDLPSINNKEVVPIVMSVILKSKLFYFISDLSYIREFGADILDRNSNLSEIYKVFEESLNRILNLNSNTDKITVDKLQDKLSVCDTINFIETLNKEDSHTQSVFSEERKRVAKLIISATTEDLDNFT